MIFNQQNSNDEMADHVTFPLGGRRDDYNGALSALSSEITAVRSQLDIAFSKLDGDETEEPWDIWDDAQEALSNASRVLNSVGHGLEERPPARPPGTVIPTDVYPQKPRPSWGYWGMHKQLVGRIDVVLARYIPLSKQKDIFYNQIAPTRFLDEMRRRRGKKGSMLYCTGKRSENSRAELYLEDKTKPICGDVYWVPAPLETEKWFSQTFEPQSMEEARSSLHDFGIERFTIDQLRDGRLLLSCASPEDQVLAKMILG